VSRIALVRKRGQGATGVGRYCSELERRIGAEGRAIKIVEPVLPGPTAVWRAARRCTGLDALAFFNTYPLWAHYPPADLYHLTSQNLATLALFHPPPGPLLVTVHDIIPYLVRDNRTLSAYRTAADRLFDRLALAGLRRASAIVTVSHYTAETLVAELGIPAERIRVTHLAADRCRYRPLPVPPEVLNRYRLRKDRRYLIYVGSEDPRKDLPALVRALRKVRGEMADVELLKIGRAHFEHERRRLAELAERLGVRAAIHFVDDVPEVDLPLLYNLASVAVMPSLYEGFGLPALEAMACGTALVATSAGSLPEVVGPGGRLVPAGDPDRLAEALLALLGDDRERASLVAAGLARAEQFDWARTAARTAELYGEVLERRPVLA
jgi:glycosyltransferase involved in cell wall biosynthesis